MSKRKKNNLFKKNKIMKTNSIMYHGFELIRTSYELDIAINSREDLEFYKSLNRNCPENGYLLINENGFVIGYKEYNYIAIDLENGKMFNEKLVSYINIKHMIDMYL